MSSTLHPTPPSESYWLDRAWIHDNYSRLVAEHPNQWIAVHGGRLLSFGDDLDTVEDAAQTHCSIPDIVFQFIDDGSLIF